MSTLPVSSAGASLAPLEIPNEEFSLPQPPPSRKVTVQLIDLPMEPTTDSSAGTQLENNLRKTSLLRAFIVASVPPLLSQLASASLVFSDGLITSNLLGTAALAALTYASTMDFLVRGVAQIFATGSLSMLSTLIGNEQKSDHLDLIPSSLLWLSLLSSLLCYAVLLPAMRPLFAVVGARGAVLEAAVSYSRVLILGCPCQMLFTTYSAALLGEGLSQLNMIASVTTTLLNIGFSYLFVAKTDLGIAGAATGSVLALLVGSILCLSLYVLGRTKTRIRLLLPFRRLRECFGLVKQMFLVGMGDAFSYLAYGFVLALFNYYVTLSLDESTMDAGIAALGALGRIYGIFSAIHLTFGSLGYLPLASYFVGASNGPMLLRVTKISFWVMTVICLALSVLLIFLSHHIGLLFSTDPVFLHFFKWSMFLCSLTSVLAGYQYIGISFLQALGQSTRLLVSSFLCLVAYMPLGILVMYYSVGTYISLILSYTINDILSVFTCAVFLWPVYRRLDAIIAEYLNEIEENAQKSTKGPIPSALPGSTSDDGGVIVAAMVPAAAV